jgi:hypothetical protein
MSDPETHRALIAKLELVRTESKKLRWRVERCVVEARSESQERLALSRHPPRTQRVQERPAPLRRA